MNRQRLSLAETFELLASSQEDLSTNADEEKLLQIGPIELQEGKNYTIKK